jgi:uncharacterized membrane protein (DUF2068 family)
VGIVEVMIVVALLAAIAVCATAIWALREAVGTMRSLKAFTEDTRSRLDPLLEKAEVAVDAVTVELLRIDAIIGRFEEAGDRVSTASGAISGIVNAPTELVNEVASRVLRAWKDRHHRVEER